MRLSSGITINKEEWKRGILLGVGIWVIFALGAYISANEKEFLRWIEE